MPLTTSHSLSDGLFPWKMLVQLSAQLNEVMTANTAKNRATLEVILAILIATYLDDGRKGLLWDESIKLDLIF